jgi:hypothetical protein
MNSIFNLIRIFILFIPFLIPLCLYSQMDELHGDENYSYRGWHSGNMIRTTFYNDGMIGHRRGIHPDDIYGEWPINSGHLYLPEVALLVGSEVKDTYGEMKRIISESHGTMMTVGDHATGDLGPGGKWRTFCPLPGFANVEFKEIAMSHKIESWPSFWPDKMDDQIDPGWPGSWNGYFGKDELNADQESYYVIDDYNNDEFSFYPDSTNTLRRGLGMRVTCRGFQWSNVLVEDVLFLLYDIKNIGTYSHNKMNFGCLVGVSMGRGATGFGDAEDDCGAYDLEEETSYSYDFDDIGDGGWTPIGYMGCAFFESPGNPFDGIDNDGDGSLGTGSVITAAMFTPRTVNAGDPIVLIDYATYQRTVTEMPNNPVQISYRDTMIEISPGDGLVEIENDLIDNNLNGIIDENNGSKFGEELSVYLYDGLKYIDYFTGEGLDNPLIDERRDDGIDNNQDWSPITDDLGLDGIRGGNTIGENDGLPTSGWQPPGVVPGLTGTPNQSGLLDTGLPGEAHIDKTDINESDMIGLTAFNLYAPYNLYPLWDDAKLWEGIRPGLLDARLENANVDLMFGSGYFPMKPGQIERFSIGVILGLDIDELFRNKEYAEIIYLENYNFAKAPIIPTLTAVPGDRKVTLYWDDAAENTIDPISGRDFEGYKIYRSTDKTWGDMTPITDGYGSVKYLDPIAQFDLKNGYSGFSTIAVNGVQFWLGDNTGLVHSFIDSNVVNGYEYYYAVTSYDHGDPDPLKNIAPSECSKYISVSASERVDMGKNVAVARPEAPSAGYVSARLDSIALLPGGTATGTISYRIVDPDKIANRNKYRIFFEDTLIAPDVSSAPLPKTKSVSVININNLAYPDTLINRSELIHLNDILPITDGFQLILRNDTSLVLNESESGWSSNNIYNYSLQLYKRGTVNGYPRAADYRIEFGEDGMGTSSEFTASSLTTYPAIPVNFRITNVREQKQIQFAIYDRNEDNRFSAVGTRRDEIIFLEVDMRGSIVPTWHLRFVASADDSIRTNPVVNDFLELRFKKPFLSHDIYEFVTSIPGISQELAKADLSEIKVVPNPYIVANSWEDHNPYASGRGPRELHFIHLPPKCTIRIFNMKGQLVDKIEHNAPNLADGTEIWDMLSKDELSIAYGVYIYHIDAGKLGQKIGKFAVIK